MIGNDENKISIFGSDRRKYVRRCYGEEVDPDFIPGTTKNSKSVIIWARMSAKVAHPFHAIDSTLNIRKYINTILLLPSIRELFPDNAAFFLASGFSFLPNCMDMQTVTHG